MPVLINFALMSLCFLDINLCDRPKSLVNLYYKLWKPLKLVRKLRQLDVDPFDVLNTLEAVKDYDTDEALNVLRELNIKPVKIYNTLDDLVVDPIDAYYSLKCWLVDPYLHKPGDNYHRVNLTGDPSHPYLHLSYGKTKSDRGMADEKYEAQFLTSGEINKALEDLENEYEESIQKHKIKMASFIEDIEKINNVFGNPRKTFSDVMGEKNFEKWKKMYPEAFEGLSKVYKSPFGPDDKINNRTEDEIRSLKQAQEILERTKLYEEKERRAKCRRGTCDGTANGKCVLNQFSDPNRYDKLQDETFVETDNNTKSLGGATTKTHYIKRFYDKFENMYIECRQTEAYTETAHGKARSVSCRVNRFDPQSYQIYRNKTQQGELKQQSTHQPYFHQSHPQVPTTVVPQHPQVPTTVVPQHPQAPTTAIPQHPQAQQQYPQQGSPYYPYMQPQQPPHMYPHPQHQVHQQPPMYPYPYNQAQQPQQQPPYAQFQHPQQQMYPQSPIYQPYHQQPYQQTWHQQPYQPNYYQHHPQQQQQPPLPPNVTVEHLKFHQQ